MLKRCLVDGCVTLYSQLCAKWPPLVPSDPKRIFVLRNNDMGDLLVTTPLFEALKSRYPNAAIVAGIGRWNAPILANNPFVDEVLYMDAPWHNKQVVHVPHNTPRGLVQSLRYIATSPQVQALKHLQCDIGIDVVGSPEGALLLVRGGCKYRVGVHGYATKALGYQAVHTFDTRMSVCEAGLKLAEKVGVSKFPLHRPQIFVTREEHLSAESKWSTWQQGKRSHRIILAPGAGLEDKRWPIEYYAELAALYARKYGDGVTIAIVGSAHDSRLAQVISEKVPSVIMACGLPLREVFALTQCADWVLCNSSLMLHVAAAMHTSIVLLLGPGFEDAEGHVAQWGYPGPNFWAFGKRSPSDRLPDPQFVWKRLPVLV